MKITVNGMAMEMPEGSTIEGLLNQLEVRRDYIAVALNREVMPKDSHTKTVLREGDWVEIVHPMQGG